MGGGVARYVMTGFRHRLGPPGRTVPSISAASLRPLRKAMSPGDFHECFRFFFPDSMTVQPKNVSTIITPLPTVASHYDGNIDLTGKNLIQLNHLQSRQFIITDFYTSSQILSSVNPRSVFVNFDPQEFRHLGYF